MSIKKVLRQFCQFCDLEAAKRPRKSSAHKHPIRSARENEFVSSLRDFIANNRRLTTVASGLTGFLTVAYIVSSLRDFSAARTPAAIPIRPTTNPNKSAARAKQLASASPTINTL